VSGTSKYCHKCGAELPSGATFCPVCGTPVFVPPPTGPSQPPPTPTTPPPPSTTPPPYYSRREYRDWRREQRRNEKQEKQEKHEKSEKGEKGAGGTIIGPIIGGAILIWLGLSFYLQQINYFPSGNWWAFFVVGLGIIIILQGVLLYSRSRRPFFGPFIGGAVLVIVGLSFLYGSLSNFWPLILVVIGIAILASAFGARRRNPAPS